MTGIQLAARIALITTFVAVAFLCSRAEAASGSPVGVVVSCARNDLVGSRFCFAFKEKIRASAGYESVQDSDNPAAGMRAVCVDATMAT